MFCDIRAGADVGKEKKTSGKVHRLPSGDPSLVHSDAAAIHLYSEQNGADCLLLPLSPVTLLLSLSNSRHGALHWRPHNLVQPLKRHFFMVFPMSIQTARLPNFSPLLSFPG